MEMRLWHSDEHARAMPRRADVREYASGVLQFACGMRDMLMHAFFRRGRRMRKGL